MAARLASASPRLGTVPVHSDENDACQLCETRNEQPYRHIYLRKDNRPPTPPKKTRPPILYSDRIPNLTASTEDQLRWRLEEQGERVQALTEEVNSLRQELTEARKSSREVSGFLKREIGVKEQNTRDLDAKLVARTRDAERQLREVQQKMQARLREKERQLDETELQLRREVAELKEDNKHLRLFLVKGQQKEMEKTIEKLRQELETLKENNEKAEHEHKTARVREKEEYDRKYELALQNAKKEAMIAAKNELGNEVLVQQKQRLLFLEELEEHKKWREEYLKERDKLRARNLELKDEVDLLEVQLKDARSQYTVTKKHNEALFQACKVLHAKVEALIGDDGKPTSHTSQSKSLSKGSSRAVADADFAQLQEENQQLRRSLDSCQRTLKEVRRDAKQLVQARSTVEQFLLEAIDNVRDAKAAEKRDKAKADRLGPSFVRPHAAGGSQLALMPPPEEQEDDYGSDGGGAFLTDIRGPATPKSAREPERLELPPVQQTPQTARRSDDLKDVSSKSLSSMTWDEKEQVLRLLFKKIHQNQRETAQAKKRLTDHIRAHTR